ncbi:MAG: hypothetical protein LRY73_18740 [Bacillus sp. (in: Bacteria)]|nr:hypothetical protein [Bacillus sp. (in: firmicutes)]
MKKLVGFFVFFLAIFPVFHNQYDQVFATNDFTGPLEIGFVPQDTFVDPEKSIVYMTRQSSNVLYAINYETGIINTLTLPYPAGKLDWYGGKLYVTQHKMPHTNSTTVPLIGAIAEVGAVQFQLIDVFDIHTDPYDITIDKHGFLYVTPGSGQWQHMKVYSLYDKTEITNGHTAHMRQRSPIHYNEVTSKVYTITSDVSPRNVTAFDIDQGKLTGKYNSPYHGQFKLTPNAKISPDGRFMYNFNGVIFRLAPQRPNDLIYHFSLGEVFRDFSFSLEDDLTFAASRDGGVDVFIYDTDFYLYTIKEEVLVHKLQFNEGLIMVYTENGKHFIEYLEDYGPDPLAFVEGYYFQMEDDGEMGLYDFYDGVTSIPRDTLLALVFNQIIFLEDEDHIILTGPNGLVPVEVDDEEGLLFIEPANLTANTDYILTIGKDSISDFFGNVMSEDLVIHFTTEIPAVSNVELRPSAFDKITVQWLPVAGVDGYEIFRATASDGPFRRVATVSNGNAVSHVNGSLDTGTTYYYQVRAFRNIHGKKSIRPVLANCKCENKVR